MQDEQIYHTKFSADFTVSFNVLELQVQSFQSAKVPMKKQKDI